jgi:hypothetical protein
MLVKAWCKKWKKKHGIKSMYVKFIYFIHLSLKVPDLKTSALKTR